MDIVNKVGVYKLIIPYCMILIDDLCHHKGYSSSPSWCQSVVNIFLKFKAISKKVSGILGLSKINSVDINIVITTRIKQLVFPLLWKNSIYGHTMIQTTLKKHSSHYCTTGWISIQTLNKGIQISDFHKKFRLSSLWQLLVIGKKYNYTNSWIFQLEVYNINMQLTIKTLLLLLQNMMQ